MKYPVDETMPDYGIDPIGHAYALAWILTFTP
jgi:hypothetical protein